MPTGSPRGLILIERRRPGFESAGPASGDWSAVAAPAGPPAHPWDHAHRVVAAPETVGLESAGVAPAYAEPDTVQSFPYPRADGGGFESGAGGPCGDRGPDDFWPTATPAHGWHLDAGHSDLKAARERVGDSEAARGVRVAHLDTGYDPDHPSRPLNLRPDLGRNFAGGDPADATDPGRHGFGDQPGHGTATLALLAGGRVAVPSTGFDDYLGGAPYALVVPVRVANSVVQFQTSAVAAGLNYAVECGAWVVSMSMGGLPARSWAAAVNRAYEAGVAVFAASGNRFGRLPPSTTVWPARFGRVTAVTGVTADGTPYYRGGLHRHMQGCHGPPGKMATALAAYTPNTPWAVMGCGDLVGYGGGTSSATPQAAAAAALWLATHPAPPGTAAWQRVEAVRHALFAAADRSHPDYATYFGQGVLKAVAALDRPFRGDLPPAPADEVSFPWVRIVGGFEAAPAATGVEQMYEVEALQAYLMTPELHELVGDADPQADALPPADRRALVDALRQSPRISDALRRHLGRVARAL